MDKIKKYAEYALFALFGIYTADVIYRIIRYVSVVVSGTMLKRVVFLLKQIIDDGESFMILSFVTALLVIGLAVFLKAFKLPAIICLGVSAVCAAVFIFTRSSVTTEWNVMINSVAIFVPLFLVSSALAVIFGVFNVYKRYLKK